MATKKKSFNKYGDAVPAPFSQDDDGHYGFDVTIQQTIGRVTIGGHSDMNPQEAAMALIGRHGEVGVYTFPGPEENTMVRVDFRYVQETTPSHPDETPTDF